MFKKILVVIVFIACFGEVMSQNMNLPYSFYGIGEIDQLQYDRASGMAGTNLAQGSYFNLYTNNPASPATLAKSYFAVEAYGMGQFSSYSGKPVPSGSESNKDMWFKEFKMGIKLTKFWAGAVGIRQLSKVSYNFVGSKSVEGSTEIVPANYVGSGGLNKYYWINAFQIKKHFFVGVNSTLIAGPINVTEQLYETTSGSVIETNQRDNYLKLRFEYGAMYSGMLNKSLSLSVGAKFIPKTNLFYDRSIEVKENINTTILENTVISNSNHFSYPTAYGGGVTLTYKTNKTLSINYYHEDWSSLGKQASNWALKNSDRYSIGFQFSRLKSGLGSTVEKNYFQVGAVYDKSYLKVNNQDIDSYGFTLGYGGILRGNVGFNLAAEIGTKATTNNNLVKDNYFRFTLGLSFIDYFYSKGRLYD